MSVKKVFRCLYRRCPPLPIPNREVKPARADGIAVTGGRVGRCLILYGSPLSMRTSGFPVLWRSQRVPMSRDRWPPSVPERSRRAGGAHNPGDGRWGHRPWRRAIQIHRSSLLVIPSRYPQPGSAHFQWRQDGQGAAAIVRRPCPWMLSVNYLLQRDN